MTTLHNRAPCLAVTPGEPAGIGADVLLTLAREPLDTALVAVASADFLRQRAIELDLDINIEDCPPGDPIPQHRPRTLLVSDTPLPKRVKPGVPETQNAPYILETLKQAVQGCLNGRYAAVVTGPVNKGVINDSGIPFSGHTEYLAQLTGTPQVVMMLATKGLRVPLATTHLPLRAVADAITPEWLENALRITHGALARQYQIERPRILVCGLNPHAGEGGHLGHEDGNIIVPVIERLAAEGLRVEGPLPADTVFTPPYMQRADAVMAMYHDQGLPVLKHLGFGRAVNVTLGLPFIRTSVDHGTAFDLAGTGRADTGSLLAAIEEALMIASGESDR